MGRRILIVRTVRPAPFPRPGEPIVPRLLEEVVAGRRAAPGDHALDLVRASELGGTAWRHYPEETCRQLAMLAVDRVQTRLAALPPEVLDAVLPAPAAALAFRLERRTLNTLRRAVAAGATEGPWTLRRYLKLPRFGGRALVDLLAAVEAREGGLPARAEGLAAERALDRAIGFVAHRLPISEENAREELGRAAGGPTSPVDLSELARAAARRRGQVPFRMVEIGNVRVAVPPSQVTAARAAHRIALRAMRGWGAAAVRAVAAQLRGLPGAPASPSFVADLLSQLPTFRWVDRRRGWFALGGATGV
jgi:hypothetical protein